MQPSALQATIATKRPRVAAIPPPPEASVSPRAPPAKAKTSPAHADPPRGTALPDSPEDRNLNPIRNILLDDQMCDGERRFQDSSERIDSQSAQVARAACGLRCDKSACVRASVGPA
jgi:hypothetical protein